MQDNWHVKLIDHIDIKFQDGQQITTYGDGRKWRDVYRDCKDKLNARKLDELAVLTENKIMGAEWREIPRSKELTGSHHFFDKPEQFREYDPESFKFCRLMYKHNILFQYRCNKRQYLRLLDYNETVVKPHREAMQTETEWMEWWLARFKKWFYKFGFEFPDERIKRKKIIREKERQAREASREGKSDVYTDGRKPPEFLLLKQIETKNVPGLFERFKSIEKLYFENAVDKRTVEYDGAYYAEIAGIDLLNEDIPVDDQLDILAHLSKNRSEFISKLNERILYAGIDLIFADGFSLEYTSASEYNIIDSESTFQEHVTRELRPGRDQIRYYMTVGKRDYMYEHNAQEYLNVCRALDEARPRLEDANLSASGGLELKRRFDTLDAWWKKFRAWFEKNGFETPKLDEAAPPGENNIVSPERPQNGKKVGKRPKTRAYKDEFIASKYAECVLKTGKAAPTQLELAKNSEISQPRWSNYLRSPRILKQIVSAIDTLSSKNEILFHASELIQKKYEIADEWQRENKNRQVKKKIKSPTVSRNHANDTNMETNPEVVSQWGTERTIREIRKIRPNMKRDQLIGFSLEILQRQYLNLVSE